MDGGAEVRAAEGGAGLEGEGEDEWVKGERKGGVYEAEERERLFMTGFVDVGGQLFC